ncbi:corticotropin-releasing factor receptor 2 [Caerostris extrusa]|uniref:Corticotropin-releasing factor receptor 2 n=1 Tax=Caerostris extrusa TaxID=172846 RepID=A0AAV4QZK3_CAEEX|nr:corticotropin-releasing factor receptor 2 [Caerostris extrusa]
MKTSSTFEIIQVRRAMKATALLFPLLGITHLLFCVNPRDDSKLEEAYMITNATLQSSQKLFFAFEGKSISTPPLAPAPTNTLSCRNYKIEALLTNSCRTRVTGRPDSDSEDREGEKNGILVEKSRLTSDDKKGKFPSAFYFKV